MLEKTAFAEKAMTKRPSHVVLPPIPLTLSAMIQTREIEVLVIGDGNFNSQQIDTSPLLSQMSEAATPVTIRSFVMDRPRITNV
jgi:hypothetical protein